MPSPVSTSSSLASASLRSASLPSAGSGGGGGGGGGGGLGACGRPPPPAAAASDASEASLVDPTPFTVGKEVDLRRREADLPPRYFVDTRHYTPAARYRALELHRATDFERALGSSSGAPGGLPCRVVEAGVGGGARFALRWRVEPDEVDVARELPRFLRGVRAAAEPAAFAAVAGAAELLEACRRRPQRRRVAAMLSEGHAAGRAAPFVAAARAALGSPDRRAAAHMMLLIGGAARSEKAAAAALAPLLKRLLPSLLRYSEDAAPVAVGFAGQKGLARARVLPMSALVDELLATLLDRIRWPAYAAIKSFWPLYQDLDFERRHKESGRAAR